MKSKKITVTKTDVNCPKCGSTLDPWGPNVSWYCGTFRQGCVLRRTDDCRLRELRNQVADLQTVIKQLPKLFDGSPAVPGMVVYVPRRKRIYKATVFVCCEESAGRKPYICWEARVGGGCVLGVYDVDECFPTKEAAREELRRRQAEWNAKK